MNVLYLAIFIGLLETDNALGVLRLRHRVRAIERQASAYIYIIWFETHHKNECLLYNKTKNNNLSICATFFFININELNNDACVPFQAKINVRRFIYGFVSMTFYLSIQTSVDEFLPTRRYTEH